VKKIKFHRLTPPFKTKNKVELIMPTKYELLEFMEKKDVFRKENRNIEMRFPVYSNQITPEQSNKHSCFLETNEPLITISENGDIYPCCLLINQNKYIIGNINRLDSNMINQKTKHMLLKHNGHFINDCIAFVDADGTRNCPLRFE
jgi:radical SAM protein with 4Fe4S-binding SPASM domain